MLSNNRVYITYEKVNAQLNKYTVGTYNIVINATGISNTYDTFLDLYFKSSTTIVPIAIIIAGNTNR